MSIGKTSVSTVCPSTLTYKHRQNLENISKTKKVAQNMTEKPFGQKLEKKVIICPKALLVISNIILN